MIVCVICGIDPATRGNTCDECRNAEQAARPRKAKV